MPVVQEQKNEYQKPQIGLQPGRCVKIIDLGTQNIAYDGEPPKLKRQLKFQWELPQDLMEDGKPLVASKSINLAIGDKAILTKLAKASLGIDPKAGFDPLTLINTVCNLNFTEWFKNGKSGIGIDSFAPLMKGQQVPAATNPLVLFDLDKFDQAVYDSLHEYYRETIAKSPEYAELKSGNRDYAAAKNTAKPTYVAEDADDEIPF